VCVGFYLQSLLYKTLCNFKTSGTAVLTDRRNVKGLSEGDCRQGGRNVHINGVWMIPQLVKSDSPNCDTVTANRTVRTGLVTVPADGYQINIKKLAAVL
jgi:hypothetical protein